MRKVSGLFTALFMALALQPPAALAQFDDGGSDDGSPDRALDRRMYVAPMFSYTGADADRRTDDGIGGTISVGRRMTSGLNLELSALYQQFDLPVPNPGGETTATLAGFGLGAMLFLSRDFPGLFGLLSVHQGQSRDHPTTPASDAFGYQSVIFDTGVGYLYPLADLFGGYEAMLRVEARYRMDQHTRDSAGVGNKKSFYEGVANIGLLVPLGRLPVEEEPEPIAIIEPEPPADSDSDGIPDDLDQCPDTAFGSTVDDTGCEQVTDADGDGVPDSLDACPDTPFGTPVDEQGCPLSADADGDGVPDDLDQCPNTPAGTAVTETGCAEPTGCREPAPGEPISLEGCATGEAIVLRGVTFEPNEARLTSNAKVILDGVADSLIAAASAQVEVGGHTDSQGSDEYNLGLSEKRARSVYDYLVSRGVPADRLSSKGYGEAEPVDTNETAEGREANRRVVLKLIGQ